MLFISTHLLYMITYLKKLDLEPLQTSGVHQILIILCSKTASYDLPHYYDMFNYFNDMYTFSRERQHELDIVS